MKHILISILLLFVQLNLLMGQSYDSLPIFKTKYQHLVVNYNDQFLKYTDVISIFDGANILKHGLMLPAEHEDDGVYFINGVNYKHQFYEISQIDTINTVRWLNGNLPQNHNDSSSFEKKIKYSYILYKFNETRLNQDTLKKVRLVLPEDQYNGQGKWTMYEIIFYKDSTVLNLKQSDVIDTIGRRTINSVSKKLKIKNSISIFNDLKEISKSKGYECFQNDYYPWLLEYYDGTLEHSFIFSNRCKEDMIVKNQYEKIIRKLLMYAK